MLQDHFNRFATLMLGRSMVQGLIGTHGKVSVKKYRRYRRRLSTLRRQFNQKSKLLEDIGRACARSIVPVTAPLVLISQIQRSGGSLLSQLFDGHPQLHAHPHELKIGFPKKYIWPEFDPKDTPERWFEMIFEDDVIGHFQNGYEKGQKDGRTFAFIFLPALQRRIFLDCLKSGHSFSPRDVLNAYMTAYFNAWLNNRNCNGGKKYVTAFTPRLSAHPQSIQSFFTVYPDGRLISIVRDPRNWYPSARRHVNAKDKYADIRQALFQWTENAHAMLRNKHDFGERVLLIRFEDLISQTEAVMRRVAAFLDIELCPILLVPTFNKSFIQANTSFRQEGSHILSGTLERHRNLNKDELELIAELTGEVYRQVLSETQIA